MVKLKHIKKISENKITCDAFVEDCETAVPLVLDIEKEAVEDYTLPKGYEYCDMHIAMAKFKLLDMVDDGHIEEQTTVMWY